MPGAEALDLIDIFNVFGSAIFGWAGGRWPKRLLLGLICTTRSLVLAWYFISPPAPTSTLLFASIWASYARCRPAGP